MRARLATTVEPAVAIAIVIAAAVAVLAGCSGTDGGGAERSTTASTAPDLSQEVPVGLRAAVEPTGEVRELVVDVDGAPRSSRLYVPTTLPDGPVPLFVALHGGGGWGDQFARTNGSEALAEANGFLVAHPTGTPIGAGPGATWNGGACCGPAARTDVDDVAALDALIGDIGASFDVDPDRTYVFGHSNGGIMAYRLACELADRVAGIGAVGATIGVDDCEPGRPVSSIHIHGTADTHLPLEGGVGPDSVAGVDFAPVADGIAALVAAGGCPGEPTRNVDGVVAVDDWAPCDDGAGVRLVTIDGAGHAWPGGSGPSLSGTPYPDLDATAEIMGFLLGHPRR